MKTETFNFTRRAFVFKAIVLSVVILICAAIDPRPVRTEALEMLPYQDPQLSIDERVKDLLGRMTLEEKVYQMNQFVGLDHMRQAEKNLTETGNANITVNSVDDKPTIVFEVSNDFSKNTMLFEDIQTFRVIVSDIDTDIADLTFDTLIGDQSINSTFTLDTGENINGSGVFEVNLSALEKAGLYSAQLRVSDSTSSGTLSFETWFVS